MGGAWEQTAKGSVPVGSFPVHSCRALRRLVDGNGTDQNIQAGGERVWRPGAGRAMLERRGIEHRWNGEE